MFELTNEQRMHFGLLPVETNWVRLELKNPPGWCSVIAYVDGTTIRKIVETGASYYREYELSEKLSDDLRYLQPKTERGKPVLLSASTLEKRTGIGMCLSCSRGISLYSLSSQQIYYSSEYDPVDVQNIADFQKWVENWCNESTEEDIMDITQFRDQPRIHVKFKLGDVFRFKINRRLYGYGRILLDYAAMRKKKQPFWDVLAGKPLACSIYHIATDRKNVSIGELKNLNSLPSVHIMDNHLFYGSYEIIGNIPIHEPEDYPIMYGNSTRAYCKAVLLQCGNLYRKEDNGTALFQGFSNGAIGFGLHFKLPVLLACIEDGSNAPYWREDGWWANQDLRNPKFRTKLELVCKQFGLEPSQLIK